ncbi:hypothetical protein [Natrinema sp. 1APR25-10V2]|uniref:hypothetical protein n=1 Tax=Natrinema sp. 1APR25-10V2 TaxID=2951081 RepID=UPI002874FFC5|nr:hypothetical protein [Natrinema sp. 1APR25-10V2]MDS0476175.1 hypothetical protein [Natrinema sp. 1APR25-10V2]
MSSEPTVTEVFEEIEPDPDAILGAFDADFPDSVLEGAGDHDPVPDDEVDADDVTAAEVFADLKAVSLEVADAETTDEPIAGATAMAVHRDPGSGTSAGASADWEWIGPDPTETRIDNDTFGGVGLEPNGDATSEFAWFEA